MTYGQVIAAAFREIRVIGASEEPSAADANLALETLERLIDSWNGVRENVWASEFTDYTLTPSLSPHTIGPTGTFVVSVRPVTLDGANLILPGTDDIHQPITVRDRQWWLDQPVPTLSTSVPTDVYYEPAFPNGQLFFWPVPGAAYDVQLLTRKVIGVPVLTDTFTMPPGYRDAITYTLAERLVGPMRVELPQLLPLMATRARAVIAANNTQAPRLATQDAGMPTTGRPASGWSWLTYRYTTGTR